MNWYTVTLYAHDLCQSGIYSICCEKLSDAELATMEAFRGDLATDNEMDEDEADEISMGVISYVRTATKPVSIGTNW